MLYSKSGIRLGVLTLSKLPNLYIRDLISKFRNKGCYLFNQFAGCILFVDGIFLFSGSFTQLEEMLAMI